MEQIIEVLRQIGQTLATAEAILLILSAALGALVMFFLMSYVFEIVACWRIFQKAGKRGWKSLIPVYNNYIRYQIAWRPLWFWISTLLLAGSFATAVWGSTGLLWSGITIAICLAETIILLIRNFRLGRAFGRSVPFCVGLALFPPLFILILGLGGAEYHRQSRPAAEKEGAVQ